MNPICHNISSFGIQNYLPPEQAASYANKNGFKLYYIDGSLESNFIDNWNGNRIKKLIELNEKLEVSPFFHGNYRCSLGSIEEHLRKASVSYVFKEIQIAKTLNAPLIIHGGALVAPQNVKSLREKAIKKLLTSLKEILNYSKDLGVNILFENLSNHLKTHPFYYLGTTVQDLSIISDEIKELNFLLDIGHANIGNSNPILFFKSFRKKISALSLSDNKGLADTHSNLGKGNIKFNELIKSMLDSNWEGVVFFETRGQKPSNDLSYFLKLIELAQN